MWDANHPSAGQTNPATRSYAYDELDRLVATTQPWGEADTAVTTYAYDVQDHLAAVTDAEGNVTTYETSDRDLPIRETSEVTGVTTYVYNEHGELTQETDARGITTLRSVDELDRVTFVDYPGDALDVAYTYDDPAVSFSVGRLTRIERDGQAIDYAYDRFGRLLQDGELTYAYDRNDNRAEIGYPGGVVATFTHDFADRPATLEVAVDGGAAQPLVTAASYLPSGPLAGLTLGNGTSEVRGFDRRYFPELIDVTGPSDRTWVYETDALGNPTEIVATKVCAGDLELANQTVTTTEVYESCAGIRAGPGFSVEAPGNVAFSRGRKTRVPAPSWGRSTAPRGCSTVSVVSLRGAPRRSDPPSSTSAAGRWCSCCRREAPRSGPT